MLNKSEVIKDFNFRSSFYGSWFNKSLGTKFVDQLEKETILKLITQIFSPIKPLTVVDIGSGSGRIAQFLTRKLTLDRYLAIDFSPRMLSKIKSKQIPNLSTYLADATDFSLPYKADVIISLRQIKYNCGYLKQLQAMALALKNRGSLVIEFPSLFSVSAIGKLLFNRQEILFNPLLLKKELRKLKFNKFKFIPLRYLPDNLYTTAKSSVLLKIIKKIESLAKSILPPIMAKSLILVAGR